MVTMTGVVSTYGNFNGTVSSYGLGIATSTALPQTSANTTRTTLFTTPQPDTAMSNASSSRAVSATGMINITTTGNYLGGWIFTNLSAATTTGTLDQRISSIYIIRIA
jgi:hypothetical protein